LGKNTISKRVRSEVQKKFFKTSNIIFSPIYVSHNKHIIFLEKIREKAGDAGKESSNQKVVRKLKGPAPPNLTLIILIVNIIFQGRCPKMG